MEKFKVTPENMDQEYVLFHIDEDLQRNERWEKICSVVFQMGADISRLNDIELGPLEFKNAGNPEKLCAVYKLYPDIEKYK